MLDHAASHIFLTAQISERISSSFKSSISERLRPDRIASRRVKRLEQMREEHGTEGVGYVVGPIADSNPINVIRNIREIRSTARQAEEELGIPVATPLDLALPMQALRRLGRNVGFADTFKINREIMNRAPIIHVIATSSAENSATARDDLITAQRSPEIVVYSSKN